MKNIYKTTPESKETIEALWKLAKVILDTLDFKDVVTRIVESMLSELNYLKLGYRIVVLLLKDKNENILKRVSLSKTVEAEKLLAATTIPFPKMDVPLTAPENLIIKAFNNQKPYYTNSWPDILAPPFSKEEALSYQKLVEIKTSMVYPVVVKGKSLGVLIFSLVKEEDEVSDEEKDLIGGFTDIVGLAVQNAQLYTALEESSKKLENFNKRLREVDAQKDEFVSMAAHELRSPMTAIKGYLSMVVEGDAGDIPEKARGFLADATAINERLIRLVNNMLNVSRIEEGRLVYQIEQENLSSVIRAAFEQFRSETERKGLEFELVIPPEIKDRIEVDPDRIHEVVANLLSNAIKYTEKGKITARLTQPNPETVRFEVEDTGPGISKEEQGRLFQKFVRAESSVGKTTGTGLGLYICRLLVEKFHGRLGLSSEEKKGSTFWFELPLVNKKAEA